MQIKAIFDDLPWFTKNTLFSYINLIFPNENCCLWFLTTIVISRFSKTFQSFLGPLMTTTRAKFGIQVMNVTPLTYGLS